VRDVTCLSSLFQLGPPRSTRPGSITL
jgi:hypothetical protein